MPTRQASTVWTATLVNLGAKGNAIAKRTSDEEASRVDNAGLLHACPVLWLPQVVGLHRSRRKQRRGSRPEAGKQQGKGPGANRATIRQFAPPQTQQTQQHKKATVRPRPDPDNRHPKPKTPVPDLHPGCCSPYSCWQPPGWPPASARLPGCRRRRSRWGCSHPPCIAPAAANRVPFNAAV